MAFNYTKNLAQSTLASSYTTGDTTITVQSGDGTKFDSPEFAVAIGNPPQFFLHVTGKATDVLTVDSSGYDGSTAVNMPAGSPVTEVITAAVLADLIAGGSGGVALLEQHTASGSADLQFTTGISSTYDDYELRVNNMVPATNGQPLILEVSTDGGSTWKNTDYIWNRYLAISSAAGSGGTGISTSSIQLYFNQSSSAAGVCGSLKISNPNQSSFAQLFSGLFTGFDTSDAAAGISMMSGAYQPGSPVAVNAIRIRFASGNITSGIARLYGYKK